MVQEVRNIFALLPCQDPADQGCFISSAWLDSWANSDKSPDPIDNGPLLCPHGQLGLDKPSSSYRRISSMAWEALVVSWRVQSAISAAGTTLMDICGESPDGPDGPDMACCVYCPTPQPSGVMLSIVVERQHLSPGVVLRLNWRC